MAIRFLEEEKPKSKIRFLDEETPPPAPEKGFLGKVAESYNERVGNVVKSALNPERTKAETALSFAGQSAALPFDIVGNVISSVTPDIVKRGVGALGSKLGSLIPESVKTGIGETVAAHPRLTENLGNVVNVASVLPVGKLAGKSLEGLGTLGKGMVKAGSQEAKQGALSKFVENTLVGWGNTGQVPAYKAAIRAAQNPEELKSILNTMKESGGDLGNLAADLQGKIGAAESELTKGLHGEVMGALGKEAEPVSVQHWEGLGAIAKAKGSFQGADLGNAIQKTVKDYGVNAKERGIVQEALEKMPEFDLTQTINVLQREKSKIPVLAKGKAARDKLDELITDFENIKSGGKIQDASAKGITLNDYAKKVKIKDSTLRKYGIERPGKLGMNETQFAEKFAGDYPGLARAWDIVDEQGLLTNTNNLIEKLAKNPNVKLVDESDQMAAMARQFSPNQTVSATSFRKYRAMIDDLVKWDAPEKELLDEALKNVRGSMKAELINKASESGLTQYAPAMKKWADDIDMVSSLKDKIGSNPQSFINNITEKNKTESLKLLASLDDLAGTNFVGEAENMLKTGFKDKMVSGAIGEGGFLSPDKFSKSWKTIAPETKGAMFSKEEASRIDKALADYEKGVSPFKGYLGEGSAKQARKKLENIGTQNNIEEMKELSVLDGVFGLKGNDSFVKKALDFEKGKLLGVNAGKLSNSPQSYTGRSQFVQNIGRGIGVAAGALAGNATGIPALREVGAGAGLLAGGYAQSPAGTVAIMKAMNTPIGKKLEKATGGALMKLSNLGNKDLGSLSNTGTSAKSVLGMKKRKEGNK
jgi:hypothetical protein